MKPQIDTDRHGSNTKRLGRTNKGKSLFLSVFICVHLWLILLSGCGSKPTDLRTVIPGDALIYLESRDLGKTLGAVTESKSFQQLAKNPLDLSILNGMQLAVAVTGFETSEQQITEENSVLHFQPRFVAVVETNAWNWQTLRFTENKLGEFINEIYGGEIVLETSDKHGGKYFVWTAQDGRKAFALVLGSIIFFGNDETAIEKCLAVKRGEAESIAKNPNVVTETNRLAFGFISADGVAQISNLAGIQLAMGASEESEVKSFIARVLPEILRNSIKEISWTAAKTEQGIEDKVTITTNTDVTVVFNETLLPSNSPASIAAVFLPADVFSATRYDLNNPQIAWRSVFLTAQKQTDDMSGKLIAAFSGSLFEPYGIEDAELFLSAVGPQIFTAKFDAEGENVVVIVTIKNADQIKKSLGKEINFNKPAEKQGDTDIWKTEDGELAAAFIGNVIILGDAESVFKCIQARQSSENFTTHPLFRQFSDSKAVAVTVGKDYDSLDKVVEVLADKKIASEKIPTNYFVETRFNQNGIERRTVSDFGLIGTIIGQFGKE